MTAEVFTERVIEATPAAVRRAFDGPWLETIGATASEGGAAADATLRTRLGRRGHRSVRVGKRAHIESGDPIELDDRVVLQLTWQADGFAGLFPVMHALIELRPASRGRTSLLFWGRYDPPLGRVGDVGDRFIAHRVAESTVETLLDGVERSCLAA